MVATYGGYNSRPPVFSAPYSGKRAKRRSRLKPALSLGFFALLVAGAGFFAYQSLALQSLYNSAVQRFETPAFAAAEEAEQLRPAESLDSTTVLLLGVDDGADYDRENAAVSDAPRDNRADTIMLANISDEGAEVHSILRDLWVDVPGYGEHKINQAYSLGGPLLLRQTVEQLFDTRVDHVVQIDLEGFGAVVDVLGGVEVDVPEAFVSQIGGYDFTAGPQVLDAHRAEAFVRERYAFPTSDEARTSHQQLFVKSVMSQVGVTDITRIHSLIEEVGPYITVDEDLDMTSAAQLAYAARGADFTTVPHAGYGFEDGGQSVLYPDTEAYREIARAW